MTQLRNKYLRCLPEDLVKQVVGDKSLLKEEKKIVLDELYQEALFVNAPHDFSAFCQCVIKDEKKINVKTKRPASIEFQPFHYKWAELLQKHDKLSVWSPRGTGKTWIFSVAYPLWRIGRDPNIRVLILSKAGGQSKKPLFGISQTILDNGDYRKIFPNITPKKSQAGKPERWNTEELIVTRETASKDPTVSSYGLGTKSLRGARADLIIVDDVLAFDGKHITDDEMQAGIQFFDDVAKNCLEEDGQDGQIIINGTPAREGDLLHYVEKLDSFHTEKFSFEEEDTKSGYIFISWPKKHSEKKLEIEKKENIVAYNRNRRCIVTSPEEQLFKDLTNVLIQDWDLLKIREWEKYIGMDLSTSKRKGTSLNIVANAPNNQLRVVLDLDIGDWKGPEKANVIRDYASTYKPRTIYVENNALQDDVVSLMIAAGNKDLPIEPYTTGRAKQSILETLALEVKNGLWRFNLPECSKSLVINQVGSCNCKWCRFVNEAMKYPNYTSSDMLMAWMFAAEAIKAKQGKDIGVRVIPLNTSNDDDGVLSKMLKTPEFSFGFGDYYYNNRITQKKYIELQNKDAEISGNIISFIKMHLSYKDIIKVTKEKTSEDSIDIDVFTDIKMLGELDVKVPDEINNEMFPKILTDMMVFCSTMNNHL